MGETLRSLIIQVAKSIPHLMRHNDQILLLSDMVVPWLHFSFLSPCFRQAGPDTSRPILDLLFFMIFSPRNLSNTHKLSDYTAEGHYSVSSVPPSLPSLPSKKLISKFLPHNYPHYQKFFKATDTSTYNDLWTIICWKTAISHSCISYNQPPKYPKLTSSHLLYACSEHLHCSTDEQNHLLWAGKLA